VHDHGSGHRPPLGGDGGGGDLGGEREDAPQHDILEDGHAEHQAGETSVQDTEVVEDLGDDRYRGHGHRDPEDEDDGDLAVRGSHEDLEGSSGAASSAMQNGNAVPRPRSHAVGFLFSLPSTFLTLAPETNISSRSPRWYRNLRTRVEASSSPSPKSCVAASGASSPSREGPSRTPVRISPTTLG
jgi:hypothetical protein